MNLQKRLKGGKHDQDKYPTNSFANYKTKKSPFNIDLWKYFTENKNKHNMFNYTFCYFFDAYVCVRIFLRFSAY